MMASRERRLIMPEPESMSGWITMPVTAVAFVLTNIATAFYASRRTADRANKIATENHEKLILMDQKLSNYIDNCAVQLTRLERNDNLIFDKIERMRSDVDKMRGQLGTRRDDNFDSKA